MAVIFLLLFDKLGAAGILSIIPGSASILDRIVYQFLSQLPNNACISHTSLVRHNMKIEDRLALALEHLSMVVGDPSITDRPPLSSLSFSCLSSEVVIQQAKSLRLYNEGLRKFPKAAPIVGDDGKPLPIPKYVDLLNIPSVVAHDITSARLVSTKILPPP